MKITLNADIKPEVINTYLSKQKEKTAKIDKFCKDNNISELQYKDSELEYEFKQTNFSNPKPKVETRGGDKSGKAETRERN